MLEKYSLFLDEYLDSKVLHHFLSDFGEELAETGGLKRPDATTRVVPVYVWDLDSDRQLLLDRFHQVNSSFRDSAISFPSLVYRKPDNHMPKQMENAFTRSFTVIKLRWF